MNYFFYTLFSFVGLMFLATPGFGQIGHTTITFNDPDRSGGFGSGGGPGRQIQTEIYYPADVAGDNVEVSEGTYPVVVFGHGFVMAWDAYQNVWEDLVSAGYVVCFPRTEGNFSPSHEDFGLDLALVAEDMFALNDADGNLFFGHLMNKSAIMGHSMGGGATFLAAASTQVDAVVGLASAETDPSAIAAAESVSAPLLMLSGGGDAVTPPEDHQIPIYNACAAMCKYHVTITGGAHCYFANSNFNCDTGELFAGSDIDVDREEQQQTASDYFIPWLDHWLKEDEPALQTFIDLTLSDDRTTYTESCIVLSNDEKDSESLLLMPNPVREEVFFQGSASDQVEGIEIFDLRGQLVFQQKINRHRSILLNQLTPGMYTMRIQLNNGQVQTHKMVKE